MAQQIFDKTHYAALKEAQRKLHDLIATLDSAEACGMECADLRQAHADFLDKLTKIEQAFFTPPPK
jgi:hypothetical protein